MANNRVDCAISIIFGMNSHRMSADGKSSDGGGVVDFLYP